jgi:hypothetical protein
MDPVMMFARLHAVCQQTRNEAEGTPPGFMPVVLQL